MNREKWVHILERDKPSHLTCYMIDLTKIINSEEDQFVVKPLEELYFIEEPIGSKEEPSEEFQHPFEVDLLC